MLLENKDYITRNGKVVFNVFNRKSITNENLKEYYFDWIKQNKDSEILKDEIVSELSSPIKFPFVGIFYSQKNRKWIIDNWTLSGKYDTNESPNDLVRLKG